MIKKPILPIFAARILSAIVCGMFSLVSRYANTTAFAMMKNIIAVVMADSRQMSHRSLNLISLYTNSEIISAYIALAAAASVGVKMPP